MKGIYILSPLNQQKFILDQEIEKPTPDKYEIVVHIKSCALVCPNCKALNELYKKNPREKYIVGHDIAGVVVDLGEGVSNVHVGDSVVGIIPVDSYYPGCGEFCCVSEYDVVKKPERLSFEDAAAGIGDCVKAYTALFYQARVCSGDTVLVIDGATPFGHVVIQLATQWGAKVITTASSQDEQMFLEKVNPPVAQIIDIEKRSNILVSSVMEETGGVGVDVVIDNGVRMFTQDEDKREIEEKRKYPVLHKHDVISCLGMSGKWITSQSDLQLDPPDSQQLFLRGASVNFLFENVWTLSYAQHGRYQHILHDAINKLERGIVKTKIAKTVSLEEAVNILPELENTRIGKTVVNM
ncbi:quinone oxidoreductase-like protein 1 [Mytilus edulis]|uniref:quinone oxidoreductase-like protein 1 n=1 Tax=Mytilus edulis TaxID=6550 RepID=UPI0039F130A2